MTATAVRIGFLVDGHLTDRQEAAREWADARYDLEIIDPARVDPSMSHDVLWWHREEPLTAVDDQVKSTLSAYVRDGGGLLLTLRAVGAVTILGFESVAPDAVGTRTVTAPTGPLWRSVYDDHPAVSTFDQLRIPVADRGVVPYARYENQLPTEGEVLASTVESERDRPAQTSVVSWHPSEGTVLAASELAFVSEADEAYVMNRDRLAEGLISSLVDGPNPQFDRPTGSEGFRRLRERLDDDHQRPQYHVTPPANWLNDPNGLIELDNTYHLFYQYNPGGPHHNTIHWGHATSEDLVHWRDEPVALTPSPDGPDCDGCWSGCAVEFDGEPTILYTGGCDRRQLPCLATTDSSTLRSWSKEPSNPVIEAPPDGVDVLETEHWQAEFRDHCVWYEDGRWHQLIGSGLTDVGGTVFRYSSESLRDWRYEGQFLTADRPDAGAVWECPELLRFDEWDLLHVSDYETVRYFIGKRRGEAFDTASRGILDHGDFYAPQSMSLDNGYLTWGWLPEARDTAAQWDAGWSGSLSVPRRIEVDESGKLKQRPAPQLTALRETARVDGVSVSLSDERWIPPVDGGALELTVTLILDDADAVTLSVFESPDRQERTEIRYTATNELVVDRSAASEDPRARDDNQRMKVTPYDEPLTLRVFLDGSTVEIFANERHCLTSRVYPTRADSTGLSFAAAGGRAAVNDVFVWELGGGFLGPPGQQSG
jgi:beta-fructofuranosidase